MNHLTNTYQHHVDPRYFNFLWSEPMYITVEYLTLLQGETLNVTVQNLTAPPYLISAIVMHGGWQVLMAEIDISAKQNAEKELEPKVSGEVHPTIMQSIAPFIK